MLELGLINEFRGVVNENNFTYFRYSNYRDKNQWNCICSAMDWITVAVEHLADYPRKRTGNLGSIEMYSYISSVDIIVEAVQQLHRVIFLLLHSCLAKIQIVSLKINLIKMILTISKRFVPVSEPTRLILMNRAKSKIEVCGGSPVCLAETLVTVIFRLFYTVIKLEEMIYF